MKRKSTKKITVDDLARMTQNGFTEMQTVFKTELKEHTRIVIEEFRRLNAEVKDIKTTLGPTVVIVAEQERRLQTLESRLDYVENKVGIVRLNQ